MPWEAFQKTMKTPRYIKAIGGTIYPKRKNYPDDNLWAEVSQRATERAAGRDRNLERFKSSSM